jgi:1,4-dihydroxy-2-naphthoyl-CoA synthase
MSWLTKISSSKRDGRVGVIKLNRPQALNALNAALVGELSAAIDAFEADRNIGCLVITGSEKAFRCRRRHQGDGGKSPISMPSSMISPRGGVPWRRRASL